MRTLGLSASHKGDLPTSQHPYLDSFRYTLVEKTEMAGVDIKNKPSNNETGFTQRIVTSGCALTASTKSRSPQPNPRL